MSEFLNAFAVQRRVIKALLYREVRAQHGSTRLGYLWAIILPLGQIVALTGIFWSIGRADIFGSDIGAVAIFITTGFLSFTLFTTISTQVMNSNKANKSLLKYPLVMPFDAMLARLILRSLTTLVSFLVTLLILYQFDLWTPEIDSFLMLCAAISTVITLAFGVGMFNAYLTLYLPSYTNIYSILTRPLIFMSGVFYLASDRFPPEILSILYYNPILHCTEWVRSAFYPQWESSFVDFEYLFTCTFTALFIGLFTQRISQKKARE